MCFATDFGVSVSCFSAYPKAIPPQDTAASIASRFDPHEHAIRIRSERHYWVTPIEKGVVDIDLPFPMTSNATQSQAVTPAMEVLSSNALDRTARLADKLPAATAVDPLILYSSDEDSESENNRPIDSGKQSPIQTCVAEATTVTKQPKSLVVTAEKQQNKGRRVVSLLDDSDSDDDELLNHSVFDKNYRFKKKKAPSTIKMEQKKVTPNKPSNQASSSENNKRICGNDCEVVHPDITESAKLTPKEAKQNAKREIREIDLAVTMSDSEIEKQNRELTKASDNLEESLSKKVAPRDSNEICSEDFKPKDTKSKHEEKKQKVVPPTVSSSANVDLNQKEESRKLKQEMAKKEVAPMIVEPQLTPEQIKEGRILHLKGISGDRDRALQLLLWEIGFSYNVYAHQFDALLFVAGLNSKFPYSSKETLYLGDESSKGASARSKVLEQAANEFLDLESDKEPPNGNWLHILPTKGMLLADEMGLGKCSQ